MNVLWQRKRKREAEYSGQAHNSVKQVSMGLTVKVMEDLQTGEGAIQWTSWERAFQAEREGKVMAQRWEHAETVRSKEFSISREKSE